MTGSAHPARLPQLQALPKARVATSLRRPAMAQGIRCSQNWTFSAAPLTPSCQLSTALNRQVALAPAQPPLSAMSSGMQPSRACPPICIAQLCQRRAEHRLQIKSFCALDGAPSPSRVRQPQFIRERALRDLNARWLAQTRAARALAPARFQRAHLEYDRHGRWIGQSGGPDPKRPRWPTGSPENRGIKRRILMSSPTSRTRRTPQAVTGSRRKAAGTPASGATCRAGRRLRGGDLRRFQEHRHLQRPRLTIRVLVVLHRRHHHRPDRRHHRERDPCRRHPVHHLCARRHRDRQPGGPAAARLRQERVLVAHRLHPDHRHHHAHRVLLPFRDAWAEQVRRITGQ